MNYNLLKPNNRQLNDYRHLPLNKFIQMMASNPAFAANLPASEGFDLRAVGATRDRYYTTPHTSAAMGVSTPSAGWMYALKIPMPQTRTLDRLAMNVTTLGAGSNIRTGVFADNNGYPGAKLVDAGEISGATTGVKIFTTGLPLIISPPVVWFTFVCSATSPQFRSIAIADAIDIIGLDNTLGVSVPAGFAVAFPYAALPATYPAGGSHIDTAFPVVAGRFSA